MACDETEIQRQKDSTKLLAQQKWNEQLVEELQASCETARAAMEKAVATPTFEATMTQEGSSPDLTIGQGTNETVVGADPHTSSTQLKQLHSTERTGPRKKTKDSKLYGEPIILTKGDLYDISDIVREVTREALQEAMMEQHNVLGALRAQLEELQVWPPQQGTVAVYGATGTSATEKLLWAKMANTIALLKGALIADNTKDRAAVG